MNNLYLASSQETIDTVPLSGAVSADVAIVGGGYTGLSAALHLAEAGLKPVVIEAGEMGHGCSGRNGGQVNPGLKLLPDDVEAHFPDGLGRRFAELSYAAPDVVFDLIAKFGIDCAPARTGTIRAAIDAAGVTQVSALAAQCSARGGAVELLDATAMQRLTGTHIYRAGALDPRGGHINPLAYARGLARAARDAGAVLHGGSRATAVAPEGSGWRVTTPGGTVTAARLLIATNGYTDDLWPGLKRTIAPVWTYITATDPLPEAIRAAIMPCRAALYEAAWDVVYYRIDDAGRLIMGGRGPQRDATGPADYRHLVDYALKLWPQLRGIDWPWHWHGQVAITHDHFPHLTLPAPGVHIVMGYNGRGIAMATTSGREVARFIASDGATTPNLPVLTALDTMPFQAFWKVGANVTMAWNRVADRLRGR